MDQQQDIKLGGLKMSFPYIPYGIQKAMLAKIAVTLTNKEHSLIESPTGTGKTLVLLCAALAWQRQSKLIQTPFISERLKQKLFNERLERLENRPCTCGRRPNRTELDELKAAKGKNKCTDKEDNLSETTKKKMKIDYGDLEDSPYFKGKPQHTEKWEPDVVDLCADDDEGDVIDRTKAKAAEQKVSDLAEDDDDVKFVEATTEENGNPNKIEAELCKSCQALKIEKEYNDEMGNPAPRIKIGKVPRIYYGTRTHKQITQVVRELKKTCYKEDLKMCVLSSRDRTCINDDVKDLPDRNDRCQELVKNKSKSASSKSKNAPDTCLFFKDGNAMAVEFEQIYGRYKNDAFDIEDALVFAKEQNLCPYYGLRSVQDSADITFCPYNYLLDPNIRKALNINLHNAVIIFDEAHNIEDICRDSASFIINTNQIDEILGTINRTAPNFIQGSTIRDAYDFFKRLFEDMKIFLVRYEFDHADTQANNNDCLARHIMLHQEMMNKLEGLGLGTKSLKSIKEHLGAIRGEDESSDKSKGDASQDSSLSNNDLQFITQLVNTLDFMHSSNSKYCEDFRGIVSKHLDRAKPGFRKTNQITNGDVHLLQLSLLCMNSGIAFEKIHSVAWSVIVASGTLSPIESLKTELGCQFSHVFEGSHVISDDRIMAAILSSGPTGKDLNCSYKNSIGLEFQDEVGLIVRDVCQKVPNGVLCFFPSYDRMENFYKRWFSKAFIKDIERSGKKIFREEKSFSAAKFETELEKYHKHAKGKGALLFAVFRGKVSEGIDFSDKAARAVITIGIPYPSIQEITIGLKKDYNDAARRQRPHLMSGRDWYASQAFRALNQALGRCIRHKNDWGAIIMIDSRLRGGQGVNGISKWIRRVVTAPVNYDSISRTLEEFVERREERKNKIVQQR